MARIIRLALTATLVTATAVFIVGVASGASGHERGGKATRATQSIPTDFISPVHISTTFQGCNNDGTLTLPDTSGHFICPTADYTSGNLNKHWNELDLVPFRLITTSGTQSSVTTSYNVIVAGDNQLSGNTGWDVISGDGTNHDPYITPSITSGGKTITSDTSCTVTWNAQDMGPGITGGADTTIYRVMSIQQDPGTTCIIDYYMRLALGASTYSGSSLQAYIFTSSDFQGGKSTIPLPVGAIQPQSVSKDMAATRDANTPWNLTKGATPNTVAFGNVCDAGFSNTANVSVTVTWTKLAAVPSGQVKLVANVYATNPSARTITTSVSDQMYEGSGTSTPLGDPFTATKDVPANTADYLMGTFEQNVTSSATQFDDVVTATYTDLVTGVTVPGSTTASALATVQTGTTTNTKATVTDDESITGTGLTFKVTSATPSTGAPTGSFTNGYTLGTYIPNGTLSEVDWSSGTNAITDTGSITFAKTIKLGSLIATSGTLSDEANLTASDGGTAGPATASIGISSTKTVSLTINKSISQAVSSDQAFSFTVTPPSGPTFPATVTIPAGQTSGSTTIPSLAPGSYGVAETVPSGWTNATASKTVSATACTNSVSFSNTLTRATAFANKVTLPSGYESGWTFTLTKPDATTLTGTTDTSGHVVWSGGTSTSTSLAAEGTYKISETLETGWSEVGAAQSSGSTGNVTGGTGSGAQCSFTVSYPADAGKAFGCDITNQGVGKIIVEKVTVPSGSSQSFTFTPSWGSSFNLTDGGTKDSGSLNAGSYSVSESSTTGWTLTSETCDNGDDPSSITLHPGDTVTCTFTNTQQAQIKVKKVTVPTGATQKFTFTPTGFNSGTTFDLSDGQTFTSGYLAPGSGYAVAETVPTGWDQTSATCDNGDEPSAITLTAGEVVTCTFTNTQRGVLIVKKVTDPSPDPSSTSFGFSGTGTGVDASFSLGNGDSKTFSNLVPGSGYAVAEGSLTGTGWTLQSATCDNGNSPSAVTIGAGQTVTCTFTNKSRGSVRLVKTINGSALTSSSQTFQFELRQGDQSTTSTAALETLTANGTNGGTLNFTTALVPGQTYALCELLVAGYGPNISGYGSYNPSDAPNYWCFNFSITVAQSANSPSITFDVDNSHQFTKALTIGYWKNWSDCKKSHGKQTDQLGQYLDGITLGTITFVKNGSPWECEAVETLDKSTFGGTKKASDPLFNMAAQLLAADLNVKSGAGSCSAASSAISDAQALLVKYGWNGDTYSPALTSTDAAAANSLAATLDAYNNNTLCP